MPDWPTLDEIDRCWQGVVDGTISREDAHSWSVPWVEGDEWPPSVPEEGLLIGGMQSLHGVSMSSDPATPHLVHHGPPGVWIHSLEALRDYLTEWRRGRLLLERDPAAYRQEVAARIAYARQQEAFARGKLD